MFNILDDETEHNDLADAMPDKVDEILQKMRAAQKTVYDPDRGASQLQKACDTVVKNGGFWGPFLPDPSN